MEAHQPNGEVQEIELVDHLRPGLFVEVEIKSSKKRFRSHIIGLKDDEYLVMELPDPKRYNGLKEAIIEQESLIIRTIFEKTSGECAAFSCRVLSKVTFPDKLLFVSFPHSLCCKQLRREKREFVSVKAHISFLSSDNENIHANGTIIDLSHGGCCLQLGKDEVSHVKQEKVVVTFTSPNTQTAQKLVASIRSHKKEQSRLILGLAFCEENEYFET